MTLKKFLKSYFYSTNNVIKVYDCNMAEYVFKAGKIEEAYKKIPKEYLGNRYKVVFIDPFTVPILGIRIDIDLKR